MAGFNVNRAGIEAMVQGSQGRADLIRRARRVVSVAKVYAPVRFGRLRSSIGHGAPRQTGRYRSTVTVAATVEYAAAIHEGRGSRYAPWSWRNRGPGPRRFLTNALPAAGGRVRRNVGARLVPRGR